MWAAATLGPNGGASGGVAVFAREGIGIHYPPGGPHVLSPGRAVAAVVQAPGHRPTIMVSCYLCHGKGPNSENLEILAAVGQRLRTLSEHFEFVIGGDLNMEPPDIATTGIQDELEATIMAPATARGTFRGPTTSSLLDYFIVSNRLAAAVEKVRAIEASGVRGHTPVSLEFKVMTTTLRALHLRRPPTIEMERVFGPLPPPPDWTRARGAADAALQAARRGDIEVQRYLDDAYREWANLAEEEFADFSACPPKKWGERGRLPHLVWRSVVPENSPRSELPVASIAAWLGATAKEIRRIGGAWQRDDGEAEHITDSIDADPNSDQAEASDDGQHAEEVARARGRKPPTSRAACVAVLEEIITSLDADMPSCGSGETEQEMNRLRDRVREAAAVLGRRLTTGNTTGGAADVQGSGTSGQRSSSSGSGEADRSADGDRSGDADDDNWKVTMEELCAEIDDTESRATTQLKADEERKWREWVSEGIDKGASRAHSYCRLPKAWTPTTVQMADGTISSSIDDLMDEQRRKYRELWRPAELPFRYEWGDNEELPPLDASQLRRAASTFATRTSSTYDGIHPRHVGQLSDPALDALGIILAAVERSGMWPRQVSLIVATLIPKQTGGFRPIGLAPAIYRIWSKARRVIADEWEQKHRRPYFAASSGNGPLDTLWRMAARQEAGVATGETAAAVTEDLQAFFEHVDRDRLLAEAAALGFPVPIVRAALAAYSSARMLAMGGSHVPRNVPHHWGGGRLFISNGLYQNLLHTCIGWFCRESTTWG